MKRGSGAWSDSTSRVTSWAGRRWPRRAAAGPQRVLVGLVVQSRRVPRHGYPVVAGPTPAETAPVGVVTSGGPSPSLGLPIAMAYVAADAGPGPFYIDVRGRAEPASIYLRLPFYDRRKRR